MREEQKRAVRAAVRWGALGLVVLVAACDGYFTVEQSERAVVTRMGALQHVAAPGLHFKVPLIDSVARRYDIRQQSFSVETAETFTDDNQHVNVDLVVQWLVPDNNVERVYREIGDPQPRLATMAVDRVKIAFGRRSINEIPAQRGQIAQEVLGVLRSEAVRLYGVEVVDVQLVNLDYSENFRRAIDAAAVAKAEVERAEQQRRQAEVIAQTQTRQIQARAEAQVAIEQARGQSESRLIAARAEAHAIELRAQAEAKGIEARGLAEARAIRAQAEALAGNPSYVALRQAERWNGQLPQNLYAGAPLPFIDVARGR